ncbi:MAG: imidazole glycerol phosphate synthase subunit HisH [Deltaproteobacteria bacterium]
MIGIIDYGMGNIHSVKKALEIMGAKAEVTGEARKLASYAKLVLPGVGAFGDAMAQLDRTGLSPAIKGFIDSGKPFLGICLGMHLLFEESEESPGIKGLAQLRGRVRRFPAMKGLKVPQMGWNSIRPRGSCPLLKDLPQDNSVYFCHSYYPETPDKDIEAAVTEYGVTFPSVVCRGSVFACQFHPEKSQEVGLGMLKNFVEL